MKILFLELNAIHSISLYVLKSTLIRFMKTVHHKYTASGCLCSMDHATFYTDSLVINIERLADES